MAEKETPQLLKTATKKSLERVPARLRAHPITSSAWRLEVESPDGSGAITLIDLSPAESCYRGEGVFLGWIQEDLATTYRSFLPPSDASGPELLQLG